MIRKRKSELTSDTIATDELEGFYRLHGADLFGVADLTPARDFIVSRSPAWVAEFPRAISLGMRLLDVLWYRVTLED